MLEPEFGQPLARERGIEGGGRRFPSLLERGTNAGAGLGGRLEDGGHFQPGGTEGFRQLTNADIAEVYQ